MADCISSWTTIASSSKKACNCISTYFPKTLYALDSSSFLFSSSGCLYLSQPSSVDVNDFFDESPSLLLVTGWWTRLFFGVSSVSLCLTISFYLVFFLYYLCISWVPEIPLTNLQERNNDFDICCRCPTLLKFYYFFHPQFIWRMESHWEWISSAVEHL